VATALDEPTRAAEELFAPLGSTYDRYARLLSFGQDPRWRAFLVSCVPARTGETALDVACGTAAVAIELVRRHGCDVVGVDQSAGMLAEAERRVGRVGFERRIRLREGRAEALPFPDASFDHLTFTYLLRYVDDPRAVLREFVRVVRPGGTIAMLEFAVPPNPVARAAWEAWVGWGLPLAGRAIAPAWARVGSFLGPSVRGFWSARTIDDLIGDWIDAGIDGPRARRLSFGGGLVVWGARGD